MEYAVQRHLLVSAISLKREVFIPAVEGTQDETGSQKSADHRKSDPSMSVSECFETFLIEKLLPCLKREPGIFLSTLYIIICEKGAAKQLLSICMYPFCRIQFTGCSTTTSRTC